MFGVWHMAHASQKHVVASRNWAFHKDNSQQHGLTSTTDEWKDSGCTSLVSPLAVTLAAHSCRARSASAAAAAAAASALAPRRSAAAATLSSRRALLQRRQLAAACAQSRLLRNTCMRVLGRSHS